METTTQSIWQEESEVWLETYSTPEQMRRRKAQMRRKLGWLGIDSANRDGKIVDLCCGMGEALDILYDMGFRDLHGVDITAYPGVAENRHFHFIQSDVRSLDLPDASVDWLLNIHSLHHLRSADNVDIFLRECHRVLKPGGRLGIIDFPGSFRMKLTLRMFLYNWWLVTPYLRWFGRITQSEWHFLENYLDDWPRTNRLLLNGIFSVSSHKRGLFYYYLQLVKAGGN